MKKTVVKAIFIFLSFIIIFEMISLAPKIIKYWKDYGLKRTYYRIIAKTGPINYYYDNGKLEGTGNLKNGKLNGLAKEYYENGSPKMEWNYKDDKLNGLIKRYYENGQLMVAENVKDDKLDGKILSYYKNGVLKYEANYMDDKIDGVLKTYYESGKIQTIETYKRGELINSTKYNEAGKEILNPGFPNKKEVVAPEKSGQKRESRNILK